LWGEAHYEQEDQLLVASEESGTRSVGGTVPVSLVIAAVPVQYRIKDLYAFVYNHHAPEKFLASICYRELTRLAASAKIEVDVDNQAEMAQSLLGAGRAEAGKLLTSRIQKAADGAGLGVEIVFVGLQGIHPPVEVAADYQKVIGALQKKQAMILLAQAERNQKLSALVGSVQEAEALYELWTRYQKATLANSTAEAQSLVKQLDTAFEQAKGDIFKTLRESRSDAFQKAILAEATSARFAGQLKAYEAAPQIFIQEQKLSTLEEALRGIRKYVVVADPNDRQVTVIDLQEKLSPSLYELGGIQESNQP
jgi:regulator of protease activity HflC (stomatin/prohibitin superfamily)